MAKQAIIIGAGPAGLTAAYELLEQTDIQPIILEASSQIGGLSKTIRYKRYRLDIGPHRFFSKSDKVMKWWTDKLPIDSSERDITISYHNKQATIHSQHNQINDRKNVMIVLNRLTRIYFLGKLFNYPIKLNKETIANLGIVRITRIGFSYIKAKLFPRRPEKTLEDFFINRFGKELYLTFFKDYTEKVWGIPTNQISAEWGAQRVKGLSLTKTIRHLFSRKKNDIGQKQTETSLIEKFLYPRFGPGQMWEIVAEKIKEKGGLILLNHEVTGFRHQNSQVKEVNVLNKENGTTASISADHIISSMPVKDLIQGLSPAPPDEVFKIGTNLAYRDFIIVGVVLKKMKLQNKDGSPIQDNWLYIQDNKVKLGRLQVYNNWGDGMVEDSNTFWLGLEYFCNKGDEIWNMADAEMLDFARNELVKINIINEEDFVEGFVNRVEKTYPSYIGAYENFNIVRDYLDKFQNLFLIGRNGMHKYNNQDHSMLTAMQAVENIKNNDANKNKIWEINTEQEYHEDNNK